MQISNSKISSGEFQCTYNQSNNASMLVRRYEEKVWNKNAVCLIQHRVATVKTIAICWLFILQPIKAIQSVKHPVCAVLLKGAWLRCLFLPHYLQIGNIFTLSATCLEAKFLFFFFPNLTYIRVFNFKQIFWGKLYPRLIYGNIWYIITHQNNKKNSFSVQRIIIKLQRRNRLCHQWEKKSLL